MPTENLSINKLCTQTEIARVVTGSQNILCFNFSESDFQNFAPDLLITVGQNVVSKKVKQFLRKAKPQKHWHVDSVWQPDTYFSLTQKIETTAEVFFSKLLNHVKLEPQPYYNLWDVLRDKKDFDHLAHRSLYLSNSDSFQSPQ